MRQFSNEEKTILIVVVFGAIVVAISAGVVWPTVSYIHRINTDTLNLRKYLERRYENVRRMHSSLEKAKEIQEKVATYGKNLFYPGDELRLIKTLEDLPDAYRVTQIINNTNLDQANKKQVTIEIIASGQYSDLLSYLAALESLDYFLNISQLNWSPLSQKTGAPTVYQLRLSLILYVNQ